MRHRFYLFACLCITSAILLMTGGVLASHYVKKHLQENLIKVYSSEEIAIGAQVGTAIADRFAGIQNTLSAISHDQLVQNPDPAVCNPALANYYKSVKIGVGNLGRVNNKGIFYCTINPALINKPVISLGTYVQTLFNDPQHTPVVSKVIRVPNVKGYVVALHVPVYDSKHALVGTIGGAVYLNQLSDEVLSKVKFAQTGYAAVQDDNGDIIYSHNTANIGKNYFSPAIQGNSKENLANLNAAVYAARQGNSSTVSYINKTGVKKIASVQPVSITAKHRWILIVNVPESEVASVFIRSGLDSAFNLMLIVLGISIAMATIFILLISHASYKLQLAKDQFISLVSHQLRTPLTAIRLFSEMLADPQVGPLNSKQSEYVDKVHLSTIRMIRLVGDILNVGRIELKRLKVAPIVTDLGPFVQSQIDEVEPLADVKKVTLKYQAPSGHLEVPVDQILFGQVVHNLLTNAVRYSASEKGRVEITLQKLKKGMVELTVSDNGIGIPKAARKKIFKQFYRAPNAVQVEGEGTGLGLYLIKMIMSSTGGQIWFEDNKAGSGTTFHVTIPNTGMTVKKRK